MVVQKRLFCGNFVQPLIKESNCPKFNFNDIASLLLPKDKIAHYTFCIPLAINDESTCNINQGNIHSKLLMETKLIIWDEAPMMNKLCFEAFDKILRVIMKAKNEDNVERPFGGKVVVLRGDFR